uniref:Uncharacterized protein n=1 Tax=Arundo donax TaxID=35708 RepID=A0A0A9FHF3_ARUDO
MHYSKSIGQWRKLRERFRMCRKHHAEWPDSIRSTKSGVMWVRES